MGIIEKALVILTSQHASQLKRGEDYTSAKESISVIITNFEVFDDCDEFDEHIIFRRKNEKLFTNVQQFYILDLTKLPDELTEAKHEWGALFNVETEEELRMLMEVSEEMKVAGEKLLKISADEQAQEIARAREESQWAWQHTLHATEARARDEERKRAEWAWQHTLHATEARARDEGIEKGKIETAKNALNEGFSVEVVEQITKIDLDTILQLKAELMAEG